MAKSGMTTAIVKIEFHGDELNGWTDETTQQHYVVLRHMVETFGIAWSSELKKLQNHPVLSQSLRCVELNTPGGRQEVYGLQIERVSFWLGTITPARVKNAKLKKKLLQYQEECADVLDAHFRQQPQMPTVVALTPTTQNALMKVQHALAEAQQAMAEEVAHIREDVNELKSRKPPGGKMQIQDWIARHGKQRLYGLLWEEMKRDCRRREEPERFRPEGMDWPLYYYSPETIEAAYSHVTRQLTFLRDPGIQYQAKKKRKRG